MRAIKYRELRRQYRMLGAEECSRRLTEALGAGDLKPEDFSLRELAEVTLGADGLRRLDPRSDDCVALSESGDAVDVTAFSNITGEIIGAAMLGAYQSEAFVASTMVRTIPTRLSGEKLPGASKVSDDITEVEPGMPYPSLGFSEEYIETPETTKRGLIVPVTREAIFFDRTHLVLQRATEVGEILGLNKEKRILDLILGVTNNYKRGGTSYNTYYASGDSGPWVNKLTSELVDWTDVDEAEQLLADMVDPSTGEPILLGGTTVLVMPAYRHAAHRVFNATEIEYTGSGAASTTSAANPLGNYTVSESRLAYRRLIASGVAAADAKKYWVIGDFRKAFAYMENWPITVTRSPAGSEAEFNQDIIVRYKASERGAAAVIEPRAVALSTGAG